MSDGLRRHLGRQRGGPLSLVAQDGTASRPCTHKTAATLGQILGVVRAITVDHDTLLQALAFGTADFEDAVQAVCALRIHADCLLTRDPKAFSTLSIPVISPADFLATRIPPDDESVAGS